MEGIVLTHLSGSRANVEDVFPFNSFEEILVGRDHLSHVAFSESETMVSRQHLKITRHPSDPSQFFITDLKSRNGTYVNNERIFGRVMLKPGDVIQCGFGGPEFRFSVEPETDRLNAPNQPAPTANLLRYPSLGFKEQKPKQPKHEEAALAAPDPVQDSSLEYSISPAKPKFSAGAVLGTLLFTGIVALGSGYVIYRNFTSDNPGPKVTPPSTPEQISQPSPDAGSPLPSPETAAAPSPTSEAASTAPGTVTSMAPAPAVKPATTTVRRHTTVVRPRRRPVARRVYVDPEEREKRLKEEKKRREKEAKKKKSKS